MGRHLGIDFSSILVDFGRQVGRLVGLKNRWKIARNRLGCFHIALGTFQEAPERETLIFHWFWKVLGGGSPRLRGGDGWIARPPKSRFFKTHHTPHTTHHWNWARARAMGTGKHRHKGKGNSRRRAKRGGVYISIYLSIYIYK